MRRERADEQYGRNGEKLTIVPESIRSGSIAKSVMSRRHEPRYIWEFVANLL